MSKYFEYEKNEIAQKMYRKKSNSNGEKGCGTYFLIALISTFIPFVGIVIFMAFIDKDPAFAKVNGILGIVALFLGYRVSIL